MKFKVLSFIIGAGLTVSAEAGNNHHGRGDSQAASAPSGRAASSAGFGSAGSRGYSFNGGRMIGSSQRFASLGGRSTSINARRAYLNSGSALGKNRISPGTFNRRLGLAQPGGNRERNLGTNPNGRANSFRALRDGRQQFGGGGNNRVFARRSANWNRHWDRHCDHWWRGHRCRFVNGYWFIFDFGYPWYGWPSNYYAYDYYYGDPYGYGDGAAYESAPGYSYDDQGTYDSGDYDSKQMAGSPVTSAQERLARLGYYRGQIDGVLGQETVRAIMRYQSDKGLAPTGKLSAATMEALGVR